jgi:alpha-glucoside transport system substrate-binding protein
VAGPTRYDQLASHQLAWTDQTVKQTLQLLSQLLAPGLMAGGTQGALATTFPESVQQVFGQHPAAAMTSEGDFVAGIVTANTGSGLGVDADVFPFPAVGASEAGVVGGGDVAVLLRQSSAGSAFLRYLATPEAARVWAAQGGFISANLGLDPSVYPDAITRSEARSLLDAGDSFRFDMSDLQPPVFGSTPSAGMQKELADFLITHDVNTTATRLEAAAAAAYQR